MVGLLSTGGTGYLGSPAVDPADGRSLPLAGSNVVDASLVESSVVALL